MAFYLTPAERRTHLVYALKVMQRIVLLHANVERLDRELLDAGYNTANRNTALQDLLTEIEDVADLLVSFFTNAPNSFIQWTNAMVATPNELYASDGFYYAAIDVNNGSSKATITSKDSAGNAAGVPFNPFVVGDTVEVRGCSDPANDGTYTVDAKTDTVLTLTTVMAGADVAADYNVEIILRNR